MNILVPVLLASLMPQGSTQKPPRRIPTKTGRITLPPVKRPSKIKPADQSHARDDLRAFHRDVIDLRQSKVLLPKDEERILRGLEADFDDPAGLAVSLASSCKDDLLFGLMKVVERYGKKYHAEQLHFQLLTRPVGRATERVVRTILTVTDKARPVAEVKTSSKGYLFDYLKSKYSPLRVAAAKLLPPYLVPEDISRLILLSRERKPDIRRKLVGLLGNVDDDRARKRILEMLLHDAPLAVDACRAIIAQGEQMVPELVKIVKRPARGRSYGYAVFALVRLERSVGKEFITADLIPNLEREQRTEDSLLRSTCAIALGTFAYRSKERKAQPGLDKRIVDGLLDLVAPEDFITSLQFLQPTAQDVLVKFSGRDFQSRVSAWRGWWAAARKSFIGLRSAIEVTLAEADRAMILWNTGEYFLSFRGSEVDATALPEGTMPYILSGEQMIALVEDLKGLGFMEQNELPAVPDVWSVDMRVDSARVMLRIDPSKGQAFHRRFAAVAKSEMWQNYRDPVAQPDATAFWRVERKWLAKNPGEERRRLIWHILRRLPTLDQAGRAKALTDLQSVPDLPNLITEADAGALVAVAEKLQKIEKSDFPLLEIALIAPGDVSWKRVLGVLDGRITGAGNDLTTRLFRVLGPERVVISIRHDSVPVAVAAMHNVAENRNQAAIPVLMDRMMEPNGEIQRTAIYALGVLRATQAREALLAYEPKAHPILRREVWGALGRIGGAGVPAVLKRAIERPNLDDKLAALAAMGYSDSSELAEVVAARYVTQAGEMDAFSQRAEVALRQLGALRALPALRPHLQMQDGPARKRLILLLAEFQDPTVVRELIDLLRDPANEALAARSLAEITGVDLRGVNSRVRKMYAWFADNRAKGQSQWFLDALAGAKIPTKLKVEHLTPRGGVGAVDELTELLVKIDQSHLRVMTATMLRETTGKEFAQGVRHADSTALLAIADRYRVYAATVRAAVNK